MYHPYFRGKQYELITIRETAGLMADMDFVPIIEPVKEALSGLKRTLDAVVKNNGRAIVIINPSYGDYSGDGESLSTWLATEFADRRRIISGILLKEQMTTEAVLKCCEENKDHRLALIHAGFSDSKRLADALGVEARKMRHVFFDPDCGKLYRKHFRGSRRILVRDGFKRRKNSEYPEMELFSELHATYEDESMHGFGDFLIVGDDYSETGGPAYAIAIHLTYIDRNKDDTMYVYHFVSDRQNTPKDPAGKFAEALEKLIEKLNSTGSKIFPSEAVKEFRQLHSRGHFPGLGYLKKLSMQHHIETLADYFSEKGRR